MQKNSCLGPKTGLKRQEQALESVCKRPFDIRSILERVRAKIVDFGEIHVFGILHMAEMTFWAKCYKSQNQNRSTFFPF